MIAMFTFRFLLNDRRKLGHRHLESAVARHHPDVRIRPRHFRADAAGNANPIVPSPPEVISDRGCSCL